MLGDNIKLSASGTFDLSDYIHFIFQAGNYLVVDFNTKIKAAVLQQKHSRITPQIKDVELIKQENYAFTTNKKFFIALVVPNN